MLRSRGLAQVTPTLYIGSADDAASIETLRDLGITHVLNCAKQVPELAGEAREYLQGYYHLLLNDEKRADIENYWGVALEFVDSALRNAGKVLIHCVMGRSRSAAILLYCQMQGVGGNTPLSLRAGYRKLFNARRGNVGINFGFFEKLIEEDKRLRGGMPSVTMEEYQCIVDSDDENILPGDEPKVCSGRQPEELNDTPKIPSNSATTDSNSARRSGGCVWELETGAKPASERPKAVPRPPKWESGAQNAVYGRGVNRSVGPGLKKQSSQNPAAKRLEAFKAKQLETLQLFHKCEAESCWEKLHRAHFDWWMFPIDDGSKAEFNMTSEADVEMLRSDSAWMENYREGLRLVMAAWGWNLATRSAIEPRSKGMGYSSFNDVRLAKICRSLFIFEQDELLAILQEFAREVQRTEKGGASFFYGRVCLDELLYFELPRRHNTLAEN